LAVNTYKPQPTQQQSPQRQEEDLSGLPF